MNLLELGDRSRPARLAALLLALAVSIGVQAAAQVAPQLARIEPELVQAMQAVAPSSQIRAYLVMSSQLGEADLEPVARGQHGRAQRQAVAQALKAHAAATQVAARAVLDQAIADGAASDVQVLWMGNAILFSARPAVIERLAQLSGIDRLQLRVDRDPAAYQDAAPAAAPSAAPAAPPAAPLGLPAPEPNLVQLQAPDVWAAGFDGSGVLLGILDGGVWWQHPDLINRVWVNPGEIDGNQVDDDGNGFVDDIRGWDFVNGSPDITNFESHGTKCAGIAVGDGSAGDHLTGMAPGATLLVCEVNDEDEYWMAQQYCLDEGIDVLTSSYSYKWLNSPKPDYHMHRQLCTVELAAGIAHANSIGNQGNFLLSYPIPFNIATPGNCPAPFDHPAQDDGGRASTMGCGALFLDDSLYLASGLGPAAWEDVTLYSPSYPWSQNPAWFDYPYGGFGGSGPGLIKPDLMAYTDVWTTTIGTGYQVFSGTSASTPHLGGALCLLRELQPAAQPRHLDAALELTAIDMGAPGKDNVYGAGKLQVFAAARRLRLLGQVDDQTPSIGGQFHLALDAAPNTVAQGWVGFTLLPSGNFNLGPPFISIGIFGLGPSGHLNVPLTIPNKPILVGLTVHFQFAAANDDFAKWGPGPRVSVPEAVTISL